MEYFAPNVNELENEQEKGVETPHSSPHCIDMLVEGP